MSNGRHFTPPTPAFRPVDPFAPTVPRSAERVPSCEVTRPLPSKPRLVRVDTSGRDGGSSSTKAMPPERPAAGELPAEAKVAVTAPAPVSKSEKKGSATTPAKSEPVVVNKATPAATAIAERRKNESAERIKAASVAKEAAALEVEVVAPSSKSPAKAADKAADKKPSKVSPTAKVAEKAAPAEPVKKASSAKSTPAKAAAPEPVVVVEEKKSAKSSKSVAKPAAKVVEEPAVAPPSAKSSKKVAAAPVATAVKAEPTEKADEGSESRGSGDQGCGVEQVGQVRQCCIDEACRVRQVSEVCPVGEEGGQVRERRSSGQGWESGSSGQGCESGSSGQSCESRERCSIGEV